jgi:hypothetical protein
LERGNLAGKIYFAKKFLPFGVGAVEMARQAVIFTEAQDSKGAREREI